MNDTMRIRRKSKWIAGLLAMFVPGTGHMYLGLMFKGVAIMMLLGLNICGIVFTAVELNGNVLSIVLLSLLIPILYFYNLFDALQSADLVNDRSRAVEWGYGWPGQNGWNGNDTPPSPEGAPLQQPQPYQAYQHPSVNGGGTGLVLLAAGGLVQLTVIGFEWPQRLLHETGSVAGGIVLIAAGVFMWMKERRMHPDGHE